MWWRSIDCKEYVGKKENKMKNNEAIRNVKNVDELLDIQYGKIGTKKLDGFEEKAQYFAIIATIKEKTGKRFTTRRY